MINLALLYLPHFQKHMSRRLKFVSIFLAACIGSMFFHEIGHATFGWIQGVPVMPTPAKEYILRSQVNWNQRTWISLGGALASVLATAGSLWWYVDKRSQASVAILAGCLIMPGAYTLRFLLTGRGHDGTEWQEAQAALGASPAGHSLDVLFMVLLIVGCASLAWFGAISLCWRSLLNIVGLALLGLAMVVFVQVENNAAFDKHFPKTRTLDMPAAFEDSHR